MPRKVMISQPMRGKTEQQIRAERSEVVKTLTEQGFEVIDTIFAKSPDEASRIPVFWLAQGIDKIAHADCVYFMDGWQDARGCRIEHQICIDYGVNIIRD